MANADVGVTIGRPVEDVFAVLTDPTLSPKWAANAISGELLTDGPPRIGSRRRAVVKGMFGGTMESVMEVTETRAEPCGGAQADQRLVGRHRPNEVHLHAGWRRHASRLALGDGAGRLVDALRRPVHVASSDARSRRTSTT